MATSQNEQRTAVIVDDNQIDRFLLKKAIQKVGQEPDFKDIKEFYQVV